MSHSSVVSLSKALLSLRWETTLSRRSTMMSHDSSAFELVRGGSSPCCAQVCAANRSTGGVAGGGEAVRPGSDTAHLQMEMKYQKQSISRSWTVSRQRIQRCFLGGTGDPRSATSTSIGGNYCCFTSVTRQLHAFRFDYLSPVHQDGKCAH